MKTTLTRKPQIILAGALVLAGLCFGGMLAHAQPPEKKAQPKKLTGAELYAINCNRCHPERYPTEFTSAQWKTVMTHMRVRANIPAKQAKLILKYLQEDSGN